MNGSEIIALLTNNIPEMAGVLGPIIGGVFTAVFLRKNTATEEFEKIKAGKFKEHSCNS